MITSGRSKLHAPARGRAGGDHRHRRARRRRQDRGTRADGGTLIRHASERGPSASAVGTIAIAVIESPLGAALVAGVGLTAGPPSSLTAAHGAAVDLAAVAAAADVEDLPAVAATCLAQGSRAVGHDARPCGTRDGLDVGTRSCQTGVTSSDKPTSRARGSCKKIRALSLLVAKQGSNTTGEKTRRVGTRWVRNTRKSVAGYSLVEGSFHSRGKSLA